MAFDPQINDFNRVLTDAQLLRDCKKKYSQKDYVAAFILAKKITDPAKIYQALEWFFKQEVFEITPEEVGLFSKIPNDSFRTVLEELGLHKFQSEGRIDLIQVLNVTTESRRMELIIRKILNKEKLL